MTGTATADWSVRTFQINRRWDSRLHFECLGLATRSGSGEPAAPRRVWDHEVCHFLMSRFAAVRPLGRGKNQNGSVSEYESGWVPTGVGNRMGPLWGIWIFSLREHLAAKRRRGPREPHGYARRLPRSGGWGRKGARSAPPTPEHVQTTALAPGEIRLLFSTHLRMSSM
jgi:hypothetical protein